MPRRPRIPPPVNNPAPSAPSVTVTGTSIGYSISASVETARISDDLFSYFKEGKKKATPKPKPTGYIRNLNGEPILDLYIPVRNTVFEHLELTAADMRGMDLSGMRFNDVHFRGSNFQGANLEGAVFEYCNLTHCIFEGVNLRGAQILHTPMSNSNAYRTNFEGARLSNVDFTRASVGCANFKRANMYDVVFGRSNLTDTNFSRSKMQEIDFIGAVITRTRMTKARIGMVWVEHPELFINFERKKRTHECHLHSVSAPAEDGKRTYMVEVIDEEKTQLRKIVGFTLRDAKRHAGII